MGMFDKLAYFLGLKKREVSVLVIGLDNSGKSTMLNHFKTDEQKTADIVPTVGYNVEKFKGKNGFRDSYPWNIIQLFTLAYLNYYIVISNII